MPSILELNENSYVFKHNTEGFDGSDEAVLPKTSGSVAGLRFSYVFKELRRRVAWYKKFARSDNDVEAEVDKAITHLESLEKTLRKKRLECMTERATKTAKLKSRMTPPQKAADEITDEELDAAASHTNTGTHTRAQSTTHSEGKDPGADVQPTGETDTCTQSHQSEPDTEKEALRNEVFQLRRENQELRLRFSAK